MFSRRNRGFLGTCFVLISIVCFGYGLYMYDLKSVKLSESQAMLHRTERSAAQLDKKVEKLRSEKKSLEEQLENVSTSDVILYLENACGGGMILVRIYNLIFRQKLKFLKTQNR